MKWDYSHLIGRRIVAIEPRPFSNGSGPSGETTDPVITLDDGQRIHFWVEETEGGRLGVEILTLPPNLPPAPDEVLCTFATGHQWDGEFRRCRLCGLTWERRFERIEAGGKR